MISSSASRQSRLTSAGSGSAAASAQRRPRQADQRLAHGRRACGRPAARARRADRAAAVGIPAERTSEVGRPAKLSPPHAAQVSTHGPNPSRRQQPDLEHAQPLGAGPVRVEQPQERRQPVEDGRLDLAGRAQLARPARRRRRRGPCAPRRVPSAGGCRSRRTAPASPARRRRARAAPPSPTRAQRRARPRTAAGSCARRAPAPTAVPCRARTA